MSIPTSPTYVPSPGAVMAAEETRQLLIKRLQMHPDAAKGFADEVARIIDHQFPTNAAYDHAMASCRALIKDGDTQAAIDHARRALGLPV